MTRPAQARRATGEALAGAGLVLATWLLFAPWPDDWDGLGFLASVRRFDLASFSPHPPGYPVYVALLRMASLVAPSPIGAARVVGATACLVAFLALSRAVSRHGVAVAAFVCATPLVFHAFSGVGTEGVALAFAAVALLGVRRGDPWTTGAAVGLGLGVRLSWAPLFVPLLVLAPPGKRTRAAAVAALGCLAWAVPMTVHTGAARLVALMRAHLAGHLTVWGGTALREPRRLPFLVRDLLVDGFGVDASPLGVLLATALALVVVLGVRRGDRTRRWRPLLLVTVPYLVWVLLGQNLRQQPRHVVPLVAAAALAMAWLALSATPRRWPRAALGVLASLLAVRASVDAVDRLRIPPPGQQLVAFLEGHETEYPLATTDLFGGPSTRFFDGTPWASRVHPAATLGDALLAVSREDRPPEHLLVTNELRDLDVGGPRAVIATLCRPERLDRRLPCLQVSVVGVRGGDFR